MNIMNDKWDYIGTHPQAGGYVLRKHYPNGYGASVISHPHSYGGTRGLWELAVIKGHKDNWDITYDTPITDDVIGFLTDEEVMDVLKDIEDLPNAPR